MKIENTNLVGRRCRASPEERLLLGRMGKEWRIIEKLKRRWEDWSRQGACQGLERAGIADQLSTTMSDSASMKCLQKMHVSSHGVLPQA